MSRCLEVAPPGPTERLSRVRDLVRRAELAERQMKHGASGPARDAGVEAYVRACDGIVAELVALERIGALDELMRFATVTWGGRG